MEVEKEQDETAGLKEEPGELKGGLEEEPISRPGQVAWQKLSFSSRWPLPPSLVSSLLRRKMGHLRTHHPRPSPQRCFGDKMQSNLATTVLQEGKPDW